MDNIFIYTAPDIHLECNLDFNAREKWTTCKWTKLFPEVPVDWVTLDTDTSEEVTCDTAHVADPAQHQQPPIRLHHVHGHPPLGPQPGRASTEGSTSLPYFGVM